MPGDLLREILAPGLLLFVEDHGDLADAHRKQFARDAVGRQVAVVLLPTGHRHRIVVEDLVGDVHACRERGADRQISRVIISAVAKVLEHVAGLRERGLADPVRPLAAHMGETARLAVHPLGHEVTSDPGIGAAAVRHLGRRVVRAARAEIRQARRDLGRIVRRLGRLNHLKARTDAVGIAALPDQDPADLLGDHRRVQREPRREQLLGMGRALAPAPDAAAVAVIEDRFLDLHLDQLALFLDDDDQLQPLGPVVEALHVQRKGLPHLVGRDPQALRLGLVDPQKSKRMHEVQPVLAGRDEPDLRAWLAPDAPIDPIGMGKGLGREPLVVGDPCFLRDPVIAQPDVQTALGHIEIGRHETHAIQPPVDHARDLDRILHQLEAAPEPRKAAQRIAVKPVIQDLLHARRRNHRHIGIHHRPVRLVTHGRGFARVVVPHGHQHAAIGRGPGHVRVPHHVARAVDTRALAVPQPENPVVLPLAPQFGLLCAPKRGRGQILVQAGLKDDIRRLENGLRPRHLLVNGPKRRAAIAGDISGGAQSRGLVPGRLHQHQANQCLRTIQQNAGLRQIVLVVQCDVARTHDGPPVGSAHYRSNYLTYKIKLRSQACLQSWRLNG